MARTKIEWTDQTRNLWYGCTKIDSACLNCFIPRTMPFRMQGLRFDKAGIGGKTPVVELPEQRLFDLLARRRDNTTEMVFVNDLTDTWLVGIPLAKVAALWAVMLLSPWNIYQILTKRASRQRIVLSSPSFAILVEQQLERIIRDSPRRIRAVDIARARAHLATRRPDQPLPPLPNVWIGVTAGDNRGARQRIPQLELTPAAVRWVSAEPLTAEDTDPLDLTPWLPTSGPRVDWVVFGGESGPAATATDLDTTPAVGLRPISLTNLTAMIDQCRRVGAAPFVKQLGQPWAASVGATSRAGRDMTEWPEHLRVREYPTLVGVGG